MPCSLDYWQSEADHWHICHAIVLVHRQPPAVFTGAFREHHYMLDSACHICGQRAAHRQESACGTADWRLMGSQQKDSSL